MSNSAIKSYIGFNYLPLLMGCFCEACSLAFVVSRGWKATGAREMVALVFGVGSRRFA